MVYLKVDNAVAQSFLKIPLLSSFHSIRPARDAPFLLGVRIRVGATQYLIS